MPRTVPSSDAARVRSHPCTAAQKRTWILNQFQPGHPALNVPMRWRLPRGVGTDAIENAFRNILSRHEALRASFSESDGEPRQWLHDELPFRVPEVHLTRLTPEAAAAEVERIADLEARASFDLSSAPPLLRATRLCLHEDVSILLVTAHQLVFDGWSIDLLAAELEALLASGATRLPELPLAYGEWTEREDEHAARGSRLDSRAFWRRTLADLKLFEMPPDRPRPPVQSGNGAVQAEAIEETLLEGWEALANRHGCGREPVMLAALLTTLYRSTDEADLAIGVQLAGRLPGETDRAIGAFAVPMVLRTALAGDLRFADLVDRVRDLLGQMVAHRDVPLEDIIEMVRPARDAARHGLFTLDFALRPSIREVPAAGPAGLEELAPLTGGAILDLSVAVAQSSGGWRIVCDFNADVFEAETARRLLRGILNVLRQAITDELQDLARFSLLDAAERRMLVEDWNRTDADFPGHLTAPELFAAQARRTPDAPALVAGEVRMSYRELDRATSRLAAVLVARGLGPGMLAGFFLTRTADLVIALMAILKSGAAYVPLDPSHPPQRLATIVADARLSLVITRDALAPRLTGVDAPLVRLDRDEDVRAPRDVLVPPRAGPEDLAYVIYTSGSTGKPKGVQIHHRALTNFLWSVRTAPGLDASDRHVSVTTIAFDVATMDVLLPLVVGATLVLASEEQAFSGEALMELLRRERATSMFATPVTYQLMLGAGWCGDPCLKMQCGGEAIPRALADAYIAGGVELWNIYGPTETTIYSITGRIEAGTGPVLLGRAVANTRLYVVDAQGQLVPPGVPGELWIGGAGVGRGYLNRPDLTREKFLPDPFHGEPGAMIYRTGDIVRMRAPDHVEFLGRADTQVKLRGFRIELGEIEEVLRAHPGVAEAVAIVGRDAAGESALWAYVVARDPSTPGAELVASVAQALRRALPRYMCPAALCPLPKLPRLPNGKLDRRALPPPSFEPVPPVVEADEAMSRTERRLAAIWGAVLDLETVPRTGNFFELGGHSLLAVRMLARVEAEFGTRLSLSVVFRSPKLDELATLLDQKTDREFDFRPVVKLQPNGSGTPLIAINNTGIYYLLAKHLGSEQPFTSLQLFSPAQAAESLPRTFEDIAAGYVQLIRGLHPTGPYALLGWCVAGTLAFEIARQLESMGEEVSTLVVIDAWAPRWRMRLSRPQAWAAELCFRTQLLAQDLRRWWAGDENWSAFLERRPTLGRLLGRIGLARMPGAGEALRREADQAYDYDQRLLAHLQHAVEGYVPRPWAGRLLLLRSRSEPRGPFLDAKMGWEALARGGVEVDAIDGDHFTMFREPGVAQMAGQIRRCMDQRDSRPSSSTPTIRSS